MSPWQHFYHAADIGVRGSGKTLEEAFEQAAVAMTAVITVPERVSGDHEVHLTVEAPDVEMLLVQWLDGLIYEMATRHMLFRRFKVQIRGRQLRGQAWGESIDLGKHQPAVEVKGATFTELKVRRSTDGSWQAQCVVDV